MILRWPSSIWARLVNHIVLSRLLSSMFSDYFICMLPPFFCGRCITTHPSLKHTFSKCVFYTSGYHDRVKHPLFKTHGPRNRLSHLACYTTDFDTPNLPDFKSHSVVVKPYLSAQTTTGFSGVWLWLVSHENKIVCITHLRKRVFHWIWKRVNEIPENSFEFKKLIWNSGLRVHPVS